MAASAYDALALLGEKAKLVNLYDVRILPPDPSMIDVALGHERIMTMEDGTRHGGAGTLMVSATREPAQELNASLPTTRILGIPRAYVEHHRPDALLEELGLDPKASAVAIERMPGDQPEFPRASPRAPRAPYLGDAEVSSAAMLL
jgi:1-deoxy-D-xylulose-5-phosphate synthase